MIENDWNKLPEWEAICQNYHKWNQFMEEEVAFSLKDSQQHTKEHCARVLLFALALAKRMGLSDTEADILGAAAVFHDSCRQDDWLDVGHGQRAADYYRNYCVEHSIAFDERIFLIIAFHDRDDNLGKEAFEKWIKRHSIKAHKDRVFLLYKIFKDADALDRYRLASNALDESMLRTDAARSMADFAKWLVTKSLHIPKVLMPDHYLIVVDMQNDFITASLGTEEAQKIVAPILHKLKNYQGNIIFTLDTHTEDYLSTEEGKMLPIKHCIAGTHGWQLIEELLPIQTKRNAAVYQKTTFGSVQMAKELANVNVKSPIAKIELIGLCTDVCVISNALLIKAFLPNVPIFVDASCCAGTTPEKHEAALQSMESCLIHIERRD